MLTEINLINFKCFRELNLRPKLITVLIGANGTGKSSCVQALLLLKQSLGQDALRTNGQLLDLGKYADIVFKGERLLKIGISGIAHNMPELDYLTPGQRTLPYVYGMVFEEERLERQECELAFQGGAFRLSFVRGEQPSEAELRLKPDTLIHLIQAQNLVGSPLRATGYRGGADPQATATSRTEVNKMLTIFDRELRHIFTIPAIRGFARYDYALGDSTVTDFGTKDSPEIRAEQLTTTLAYTMELEKILSEWFTRITGIRVKFRVIPNKRVTINAGVYEPEFNIVNEGFGSNQLTFALTQLAISPKHSIICYEEPEIHLHPKAQSELTNVLVEVAKQENKQIVLTTHSEHILYGLLANVAEGKLSPNELSIWFFSKKNGEVEKPEELIVDENGRVESGLRGFFEVELEQLERYFNALQKKK